ncbi:hypothetical protein H5410_012116 [Solanum commersonii]|uniref:Uncharacterized protein n=1 Tax=Solanum commersonii TaxID=4109 RepID=A0A9J6ARQ8_SOLCO|nr:hypothetical protein H5410_012116 [Solanum commersonii]
MMQYGIQQLNTEQAENMSEFLLLCEYLDTCPKRNSNPKGNNTPNKVARDVPLALSAQNISTVSTDMPIPKSTDEGKSRAMIDASTSKEGKSTSSAIAEKIISEKPKSSTN